MSEEESGKVREVLDEESRKVSKVLESEVVAARFAIATDVGDIVSALGSAILAAGFAIVMAVGEYVVLDVFVAGFVAIAMDVGEYADKSKLLHFAGAILDLIKISESE